MRDHILHWRAARRERQAAKCVILIDEDQDANAARLRRWVGTSEARAQAYNQAYRAFYGAASAAQQIYSRQVCSAPQPGSVDRARINLVFATLFSLTLASLVLYFLLARIDLLAGIAIGHGSAEQRYATRVGELRQVRLADGSDILLDTATEIRVDFSSSARRIRIIQGRARFAVAPDPHRPFSVEAGPATITDRGTIFDVEAYHYVRVRLISGAIDLAFRAGPGGAVTPPLHLLVGQQVRFDRALTMPVAAPTATPPSDMQWALGMKTFDDVPVREILEETNRTSAVKIIVADEALQAHRVFLDLDLRDTQSVAENLALYLHLTVDSSTPGQIVLRGAGQAN